jgi:hypothetical protein
MRALGKRGVSWDGINLLVHDNSWSLRSHLEVTAVLHTPTSLGMLCDSFGGEVLDLQFKVVWLFALNLRDDDQVGKFSAYRTQTQPRCLRQREF